MTTREPLVRDPATGVAIAKCLMHRRAGRAPTKPGPQHPAPCRFCTVKLAELAELLDEFNEWAGSDLYYRDAPPPVRDFRALPREVQAGLVRNAQGYKG